MKLLRQLRMYKNYHLMSQLISILKLKCFQNNAELRASGGFIGSFALVDFKDGKINILVATSVIEVGVDVPNATLMVIENSERLGLSQLHQLRGRIGRGVKKSTCMLLFGDKLSDTAKKRLRIIYDHNDGFLIAEEDLKIRGPGEFLGLKQSGLPSLRIASLENDEAVLNEAKSDADKLLKIKHPSINSFLHCWLPNHEDIVNT